MGHRVNVASALHSLLSMHLAENPPCLYHVRRCQFVLINMSLQTQLDGTVSIYAEKKPPLLASVINHIVFQSQLGYVWTYKPSYHDKRDIFVSTFCNISWTSSSKCVFKVVQYREATKYHCFDIGIFVPIKSSK